MVYNKLWNMKESIKNDIVSLGDYIQYLTPIGFIIYSACYLDNHTSRVFVISFTIALLIMTLLKGLFNNPRPREVEGSDNPTLNLEWSPDEGNSFPSGHTMSAMMGAMFWFQINDFVGFIGICLGLICAVSRIVAKAHWLRDVCTSSAISAMIYFIDLQYFL